MRGPFASIRYDKLAGLAFVLAAHGAVLYELWHYRLLPTPAQAGTLFVNLITPDRPKPPAPEPPKPPPPQVKPELPKPVEPSKPVQRVVEAPVILPSEPVAPPAPPPPAPQPVVVMPPSPPALPSPRPVEPVRLGTELSVACPERSPPHYPAIAKRLGEQGRVELRVELDVRGEVAQVHVNKTSGSQRLDEAAIAAVRTWHCHPAMRDGVPVHAVALQPFNFILEGN